MSRWSKLRDALPTVLAVHLVVTVLSLVPTLYGGKLLMDALGSTAKGEHALSTPGGGPAIEVLHLIRDAATPSGAATWMLIPGLLVLLLSPALQMATLRSLYHKTHVAAALRYGVRSYGRALLTSVGLLPLLVVGCLTLAGAAAFSHSLFGEVADAQLHDLVLLVATVPGFFVLVTWAAAHDLCRARLLRSERSPIRDALFISTRIDARVIFQYVVFFGLGALLTLSGHLLGQILDAPGLVASAAVLLVTQLIALARTCVRAYWLATCVPTYRTTRP